MPNSKRATPPKKPKSPIDIVKLVRIQQQCVGRYFDFWTDTTTRIAHGNFDVRQWSNAYSLLLDESLDDYGEWLKTFFRSEK